MQFILCVNLTVFVSGILDNSDVKKRTLPLRMAEDFGVLPRVV